VVDEAAAVMKKAGLGLKAATITPEKAGDVGSPNAILRRAANSRRAAIGGRVCPDFGGAHGRG
jgi:isocitrate dehydrogenase